MPSTPFGLGLKIVQLPLRCNVHTPSPLSPIQASLQALSLSVALSPIEMPAAATGLDFRTQLPTPRGRGHRAMKRTSRYKAHGRADLLREWHY